MKKNAPLLILFFLMLPSFSALAVLPRGEQAKFEKGFLEQVNVKAELSVPEIGRNPLTRECTAVYTVGTVHGQPNDFGLTRDDKIELAYPCDDEKRFNWTESTLPWASVFPGKSVWMMLPQSYLKPKSKNVWTIDNSGKVFAPVKPPADKFQCPETRYPLSNKNESDSGDIYYDAMPGGIRSASVFCAYAQGQYELHLYWHLDSPAITSPIKCSYGYEKVKDKEELFYQVRTYYTIEEFGIHVKEKDSVFFVESVEKHSPAFNAGIERDEKIQAIDGQPLAGKTIQNIYDLLKTAEGKKKKTVFTLQEKNQKSKDVALEIKPYDSFGDQIIVHSRDREMHVELQLDPDEPITEEMKTYWTGIALKLIEKTEKQALPCQ